MNRRDFTRVLLSFAGVLISAQELFAGWFRRRRCRPAVSSNHGQSRKYRKFPSVAYFEFKLRSEIDSPAKLIAAEVNCKGITDSCPPLLPCHDEIYWRIISKNSGGDPTVYDARIPSNHTHNFEKGGRYFDIPLIGLSDLTSNHNSYASEFVIAMMEEDEHPFKEYTNRISVFLRDRPVAPFTNIALEPIAGDGSPLVKKVIDLAQDLDRGYSLEFPDLDHDDRPGAVYVRMVNDNGVIKTWWYACGSHQLSIVANRPTFLLDGDGSNYEVTYDVIQ